ncbi:hypothetical protein R0135_14130 [Congregibacter variabilis]|uniref:Uncharacterized protein n=1 Tax=Congregibacter variabilis TaxID=3081200 RepID=A0ABZ0I1H9_9GAMM|nr:hypothetical protein R0135_14130 [Congregibacter sp. IMCC43200]
MTNKTKTDQAGHQLRIARSAGGVTNKQLTNVELTLGQLIEQFSEPPPVGEKDGSYFVRGPLREGCSTRADANIQHAELLVLDGDRSFDPATGEVFEGAPDPTAVHDALRQEGINHLLYPTHSHCQVGKGNRYRVLIATSPMGQKQITIAAQQICDRLADRGVPLVNVKENNSMSQPWYEPRRASEDQEYLCLSFTEGPIYEAPEVPADEPFADETFRKLPTQPHSATPRDPDSIASQFTDAHDGARELLELLQSKRYALRGISEINGAPSYRLMCPESTSGSAGAVVFRCDDGVYRVYSHHGSDPLNADGNPPYAHDYFSVYCILEHDRDFAAASASARRELDTRPVIRIAGGLLHSNVNQVVAELGRQDPPVGFQRGCNLVRIAHSEVETTQDDIEIPAGTASIVPYKATTMALELSSFIAWERFHKKSGWIPANPCRSVVTTLLDAYGRWQGIPQLRGICEAPIMREDGTLICGPAYDAETQLYVEGQVTGITLPDKVTLKDAKAAAEKVLAAFSEFPFEDTELDRSVLLAYMLTLLLRSSLPTAPMFGVSATAPGTGKGLLLEVANLIVRGVDAALMPPVSGKESEEEMRKRITAFVLQGLTSLNLDNYSRPIGGDSLNVLLTTTEWTDRVLGTSNTIKLPVCCTLAATGNNLTVRGDMVRRSLLISLDAGVEHPERRQFKERNLPQWVLEHRPELLTALLTILKGYQRAGCTEFDGDVLGRFEGWSRRVCHPIRWLGFPDPVNSQQRLRAADPEKENLIGLLQAWYTALGNEWKQPSELITAALSKTGFGPQHDGDAEDGLEEALRTIANDSGKIDPRRLGWYLTRNAGRIAAGLRLERADRGSLEGKHAHRYRVVKTGASPASDTPISPDLPSADADLGDDEDLY